MRPGAIRIMVLLLAAVLPSASEQPDKKSATAAADLLQDVPSPLHGHTAALGDRVLVGGKERTDFDGEFTDNNGKHTNVRLTLQLPTMVRLEGLTPNGPPLKFDGAPRTNRSSNLEEALLETFSSDTAEGMFASVKDGAAVQLIARRVNTDPSKRQNKALPLYDIFEVAGPVRCSVTSVERLKRYFFDSESGLLASTQYLDDTFSPPINVETRFSDWRRVDGSTYAGRVERLENGHAVFSLSVATIKASPRQDPASFR